MVYVLSSMTGLAILILFRLFCQFRFEIPWEFDKFVNMKSYFFLYFVQCMFRMESNERMRRRMRRFNRRNACVDASTTMRRSGLWVSSKNNSLPKRAVDIISSFT